MMDQVGEACKDTPPVCAQAVHRDPPEPFWGSEISGASWLDSTPMTPGSPRGRSWRQHSTEQQRRPPTNLLRLGALGGARPSRHVAVPRTSGVKRLSSRLQDGASELWNLLDPAVAAEPLVTTYAVAIDRYHLNARLGAVLRYVEPDAAVRKDRLSRWNASLDRNNDTIYRIRAWVRDRYADTLARDDQTLLEQLDPHLTHLDWRLSCVSVACQSCPMPPSPMRMACCGRGSRHSTLNRSTALARATGVSPLRASCQACDRSVALDKQALADRSAWDVLIRVSGRDRESCC